MCLNCKRATCSGNCTEEHVIANRPEARRYPFKGEHLTIRQISERTGVSKNVLYYRITMQGWNAEDAVAKPVRPKVTRIVEAFGESHPLAVWASIRGIPQAVLKCRISSGWDPERALMEPVHERTRLTLNGEPITRRALARVCGVTEHTISSRVNQGWTGDRIAAFYAAKNG